MEKKAFTESGRTCVSESSMIRERKTKEKEREGNKIDNSYKKYYSSIEIQVILLRLNKLVCVKRTFTITALSIIRGGGDMTILIYQEMCCYYCTACTASGEGLNVINNCVYYAYISKCQFREEDRVLEVVAQIM